MNLYVYDDKSDCLYARHVRNKVLAKKEILNHGWLFMVSTVKYKEIIYPIKEVYKWKDI